MSIRAVICDIYDTLLALNPPPQDVEARWVAMWEELLGVKPRVSPKEFAAAAAAAIARRHAVAQAAGVAHPEIFWPDILAELAPELGKFSAEVRDKFVRRQAEQLHATEMMPGAAAALRELRGKGWVLGLASNSQPYTLYELDAAFEAAGLSRELFDPSVCFFSFEHGFSKPDPAVFHFLTERLRAKGIAPNETVMVGNRLDNDVLPARAAGWQAWHFTKQNPALQGQDGDWGQFVRWLG